MLGNKKDIIALLDKSYLYRVCDIELSIKLTQQALELCTDTKSDHLKAKAFCHLALYYMILGKYEESYNLSQKSIRLFEKYEDYDGIAQIKYTLAGFYYKTNNFKLGVVNLIDALIIFKKNNDFHNISKCEKSLGAIYDFINDNQNAIQCYKNAIKSAKKIKDTNLETNALINLSGIYLKNGKIDIAKETIEKCIAVKTENNDLRGLAFAIYGKGKINFFLKNYELACDEFNHSIKIHERMGEKLGLAMAYYKLAQLHLETNEVELAKRYLTTSLILCNSYNIAIIKIKVLHLFYAIYKLENNVSKSLEHLELHLKEKELVLNAKDVKIIENYDLLLRMQSMQKETEQQQEKTKTIAKNNKAEESIKVRNEFLSTISHEIRTPLNAVLTIIAMLGEKDKEEHKSLLNSLKFSSNHLLQIINDLLDFSKLDKEKISLELKSIDLKKYVTIFWNTYAAQPKEKNLSFNLILDPKLNDFYDIDETKMTQILANLLSNAIKFTDEGKVEFEILLLDKAETFDTVLFKITDTGIGIEKEHHNKIFESFVQLKNGITRKKDGTGLGLTITKKLIDLHQSEIKIFSILGKGSSFAFELKLNKSVSTEIESNEEFENKLKGLKVLLVEDNALNAMVAKKLLSKWEIIVDHAVNGLIATEKSQNTKYDYILMDIHMPVLDGYQAAKNIRTLANLNTETPIFGLTADISAKDNSDYNFYFNAFLLKPLEIEKIKQALNS
jgi:signal transduction histidine kinase/CheY-like chemotaxis protein